MCFSAECSWSPWSLRYYAWDYRVLRTFARHDTTGDVIPEKLVEALNGARNMFAATEFQRQVYFDSQAHSLFIQHFHGLHFPWTDACLHLLSLSLSLLLAKLIYLFINALLLLIAGCFSAFSQIFYSLMDLTLFGEQLATPRDTISVVANLRKQHTCWNHVESTHWHTRFNHLINYGAGKHKACYLIQNAFFCGTYFCFRSKYPLYSSAEE